MKGKKWYQKPSNWIFGIVVFILVLILSMNLYITYQAKTNEDKVPDIFGYKPFIVLSGSMETKIHVGDLIIAKMIKPETLKVDDVIAFRDAENTVTTHRIIEIVEKNGEYFFVTKGDNNSSQDQNLVEYKDVEGIYVGRIPMVGKILNELANPTNIIIIVLGVTIIFILLFQISNKKIKKTEEEEYLEYKRLKELSEKFSNIEEDELNVQTLPKKKRGPKKGSSKNNSRKHS